MTDEQKERMLRVLLPETQVVMQEDYSVSGHIPIYKGTKGIKIKDENFSMIVYINQKACSVPYKYLTCESVRVTEILAPDTLTQFSKAVDQERKEMRKQQHITK